MRGEFAKKDTARLRLTRPVPDDVPEVFTLYSDPAVWEHLPTGRHTDRAQTAVLIQRVLESWRAVHLGSWVARDTRNTLVGMGGCDLRAGVAWNLGYRLARNSWRQGFAAEIIEAAMAAARAVRPELPITAFLLEHNVRSKAAAERAGLDLVWSGPDAGNPDPGAVRLVYSDRVLDAATVARLARS
ncbi:MAG: GNAT family N-acetyltransferase [Janthinobacterium lividum]